MERGKGWGGREVGQTGSEGRVRKGGEEAERGERKWKRVREWAMDRSEGGKKRSNKKKRKKQERLSRREGRERRKRKGRKGNRRQLSAFLRSGRRKRPPYPIMVV